MFEIVITSILLVVNEPTGSTATWVQKRQNLMQVYLKRRLV